VFSEAVRAKASGQGLRTSLSDYRFFLFFSHMFIAGGLNVSAMLATGGLNRTKIYDEQN
jgi:hypothetical protein